MALGADRRAVLRLVVGKGLKLALAGAALGLLGALATTRLLQAELYQVSPTDHLTLFGAIGILMVVGLIASFVPALRATRVPPMRALQSQ
jgi:ABC-type antimicrobial peptide transport system permease subunit